MNMKITKQLVEKSSTPNNPHYCTIVPKYIKWFVILINFQFAHASMIIKFNNKVIDSLNIFLYFLEYIF